MQNGIDREIRIFSGELRKAKSQLGDKVGAVHGEVVAMVTELLPA
jgi:hypothetical protein